MVEVVMVDVATSFPRFNEETVMEDPTSVENRPPLRFSVEIPMVDAT
jgi:hypothetical protein